MIETIKNAELKENKETLLKNMKMLRHTVADMLGSKSFLKGLTPGAQNGVITVYGEQFPIYITANTLAADGLPEITEDIYDEENYLSLISDDDLLWYALVEHLAHQADLLQEDNNKYSDELVAANEEMDKLNCKLADEIKARQGYEESLKEANKKCTEYVKEIDKLEVDNKRLSERVRTLVCEKCNGKDLPLKFGEQERGTPEDKVVRMDLETALMQQQIAQLNTRIAQLEEKLKSTEAELTTAMNANSILKTQIAALTDEKREAQLLAYRLTKGEMLVQFDNMKSLEHENGVLKNENAELNQKLYQKEDEDDLKKKIAEYAQKNDDLLERNKRLNQEIGKLRVQLNSYSGASVVNHEDMQQTITKETFAELTARINELETKIKDKDERINQMSKNNDALSAENKNINDLLKNADRDARFYAREVDHLRKENDKMNSRMTIFTVASVAAAAAPALAGTYAFCIMLMVR
jgi:chromosome segregation ATPase